MVFESFNIHVNLTDLFLLTIVPVILQAGACYYLYRLRNVLGKRPTITFAAFNALMFIYDFYIIWSIYDQTRAGHATINLDFGLLFFGFIFPLTVGTLHFILKSQLACSLLVKGPIKSVGKGEENKEK